VIIKEILLFNKHTLALTDAAANALAAAALISF
jgi:hypothetical protein